MEQRRGPQEGWLRCGPWGCVGVSGVRLLQGKTGTMSVGVGTRTVVTVQTSPDVWELSGGLRDGTGD